MSEPERTAFRALQELGLIDAFRLFEQPERAFSWWDYRMMAFAATGLRIDHLLVSPALREACRSCSVDKEPRRLERPRTTHRWCWNWPETMSPSLSPTDTTQLDAPLPGAGRPFGAGAHLPAAQRAVDARACGAMLFDDRQACEGFPSWSRARYG